VPVPPRAVAVLASAALLAFGCGEEDVPPIALSCTEPPASITAALRAAPDQVTLTDGATLSACVANAQDAAALQNVGVTFAGAAEDLEALALGGDAEAALQLGYLVGAARKGSQRTIAYSAELVRRLERSASVEAGGPQVAAALERGLAAGEQRG
jgi:hypothetical protein